jgi:hypothetical protein
MQRAVPCRSLTWVTRYAAVTVALSVMTALVDIMAQEEDRRSMLDRQLKALTAKRSRRSSGAGTSATPATKSPEFKSLQRERDRVHATVRLIALSPCTCRANCTITSLGYCAETPIPHWGSGYSTSRTDSTHHLRLSLLHNFG